MGEGFVPRAAVAIVVALLAAGCTTGEPATTTAATFPPTAPPTPTSTPTPAGPASPPQAMPWTGATVDPADDDNEPAPPPEPAVVDCEDEAAELEEVMRAIWLGYPVEQDLDAVTGLASEAYVEQLFSCGRRGGWQPEDPIALLVFDHLLYLNAHTDRFAGVELNADGFIMMFCRAAELVAERNDQPEDAYLGRPIDVLGLCR